MQIDNRTEGKLIIKQFENLLLEQSCQVHQNICYNKLVENAQPSGYFHIPYIYVDEK